MLTKSLPNPICLSTEKSCSTWQYFPMAWCVCSWLTNYCVWWFFLSKAPKLGDHRFRSHYARWKLLPFCSKFLIYVLFILMSKHCNWAKKCFFLIIFFILQQYHTYIQRDIIRILFEKKRFSKNSELIFFFNISLKQLQFFLIEIYIAGIYLALLIARYF